MVREEIESFDRLPVKDYIGHGERVLVVDDEKRQREIACGILTKLGYNAEAVSSGEKKDALKASDFIYWLQRKYSSTSYSF